MEVLIVSAGKPSYWYSNRIGETIQVISHDKDTYKKMDKSWLLLDKSDCEVVSRDQRRLT